MATPIEHAVHHVKQQVQDTKTIRERYQTAQLRSIIGTLLEALYRVDDTITLWQTPTLSDGERAMLEDIETEICMALYEEEPPC